MATKLQLHIPTPCHENWENMTPTEKGRFCASCKKQVVDFSNKSDREIAMFFKKPILSSSKGGSICGRFMDDQLNREIDIPKKRIPWLTYFFQFLIPAFLISYRATAQGKVKVVANVIAQPSKKITKKVCSSTIGDTVINTALKNDVDTGLKAYQELNTSPDVTVGLVAAEIESFIINGKVVDHSENPIPFATVAIKGTKIAVAADSAGRFTISPETYGKNLTLSVSCGGFASTEKKVGRFDSRYDLEVVLQQTGTLGEVKITSRPSSRKGLVCRAATISSFGYRTLKKISPGNFKIYPNPIRSNSTLNIECKQSQYGDHLVQLFSQSGQLILSKDIYIDEKTKQFPITIPSIIPGNYFLKLTSKTTGKSYTEKLIVE